jgi:DNA-binding NarL/FixJ family response regulator
VERAVRSGVLPDAFDLLTRSKEGKEIWLNVSTVVFRGRKKPLIAHLFRNVTRQKRNEEAIQNMLGTLGLRDVPKNNCNGSNGSGNGNGTSHSLVCRENKLSNLTRREFEILSLLSHGVSNKEIAERLGVSLFTVRNHLQNALPKLGAHNKAQAISFAFTNGVL